MSFLERVNKSELFVSQICKNEVFEGLLKG